MINQSNSLVAEYSYDTWGRMRNPATWVNYGPGSEPVLFSGRGYTGHEHLPWFKLINMPAHRSLGKGGNGRLYDPLSAQFLSADKYVQAPYYTQGFNRYVYCYNNPLKYKDPTGWTAIPDSRYDISNGGETSRNNNSRYFEQPVTDIGMSSGQAWLCRNITPHIAGYQQNQYYYDSEKGYYVNGLGERAEPNTGAIYRYWTTTYRADGTVRALTKEGVLIDIAYKGEMVTVGHKEVVFGTDDQSDEGPRWEPFAGTAASIASELYYSKKFGTWMGKNFNLYKQTWGGNGLTGGKNKFGKTGSNAIKWGGRALGAWNAYSINEGYRRGEMGTGMMMAEQSSNLFSVFGGIYGAAWGVGWEFGRSITTLDAYQEFKFNFWYNRMEKRIGAPNQFNENLWYEFLQNY